MKKRLYTTLAALMAAAVYFIAITGLKGAGKTYFGGEKSETISTRDIFTNCIFNSEYSEILGWGKPQLHITKNISRYKELNFNAIHWYDAGGSDRYGVPDGVLSSEQESNFKGVLDSVEEGNLYGFYERSHLSKYFYGQRLIYEVPYTTNDTVTNYGFVYRNSDIGSYETDSGRTVLHAIPGVQDTGYLCKGIYENIQHSDLFDFRQNDKGTWFIKPVMRIPQQDTNLSKRVVRIDVISFNGVIVDSIILRIQNFRDINLIYNGNYLEKYFWLTAPHDLQITGKDTSIGLNYGRHERWWNWDDSCNVDFRVYWYGECEVWFDKMIVDDGVANDLFDFEKQGAINNRIQQEVSSFANYGSLYSFFMDEICISQYPCLQYIAKKMRDYNSNSKLSIAVTNYLHIRGLKNDNLDYGIYLDSIKPNFLQCDHHGFSENEPKIPNIFLNPDGKIPQSWFTTTADYNNKLQSKVFGSNSDVVAEDEIGSLIYEIKMTRESIGSNHTGTNFIMQPQIHGFIFTDTNTGNYNNGLREPTNEEIQAQAMISIAHGADGICWFIYNSHIWKTNSNKVKQYMLGLLAPENDTAKRIENDYKQSKWSYVSAMNGKIEKWRSVLEEIKWTGGYSVHNEGANHNFISDIRSIYRNPSGIYSDEPNCINCDDVKYWEMGFFEPDDPNDRSKYLIMVNRRCVPEVEQGIGDKRMLKIKFNVSQLQGFNNWVIKDVNTDEQIIFDKNSQVSGGYLNLGQLGEFEPGEGKLYKIAPVMQEGGTLVCDENIGNSGSFDCKDIVYGNGHNITIGQGVTINFADTAGIEMQSGNFLCGNDNTFGSTQVTLKPKVPSAGWNGVSVSDGESVIIFNTKFENPKAERYSISLINCPVILIKYNSFYNTGEAVNSGGISINAYSSNLEPLPAYIILK